MKQSQIIALALAAGLLMLTAAARAQDEDAQSEDVIVPDSEFEERLPDLDPELGAPLQPIEQFDTTPSTDPDPLAGEAVTDAPPPDDPALSDPLPPLATFDVTPPEEPIGTEAEEASAIRYSVVVEGLDEIGLEGRFRDLSALEDGEGEAANGAMVTARAREDEELAIRLMRSEGYYDGTAVWSMEQIAEEPGRLRVTITAAPGDRYTLTDIDVTGPETEPPGLAREALALKEGDPIVAAEVEAAEAAVSLELPQQGYPFVELGQRDILLDPENRTGDYTLPVDSGPKAVFGGYTTEGDLAFDAEHVGVLARFDRGELYDSRKVDDLREAMVATGLFNAVSAEPVRTGQPAPGGEEYVNILVRQEAGPPRSITGSAGYNTGEGLRAEVAWEHRNLFPPEGALRFAAVGGTQEQSLSARFRRSNAGRRDRTVMLLAQAAHNDYEAYSAYTATLSGRISRESTPIWQKRWTWAYGAELVATNESRFNPALQERERATFFIAALPAQIGYDRSNDLLNPTEGFRLLARTSPEISLQDGTGLYVRNLVEGSAYYPVSDSLVIAGRARFASIAGIDRFDLAPSRRLYAGGGGSVRGFGFQELGPRDINNDPLGGRSLNEFALEARYRFGDYGAVAFVDAGQVYEEQIPQLSNLRFGVGIGARVYTNFGPVRVDVATPLARRKGESRIALYISIGQAF